MGKVSRFIIQSNMLCLIEYRAGLVPSRPLGKFSVGKNTHWQPCHIDWSAKTKPLVFVNNPRRCTTQPQQPDTRSVVITRVPIGTVSGNPENKPTIPDFG